MIPAGSVFHASVRDKLVLDPTYNPRNLPVGWESCVETDAIETLFPAMESGLQRRFDEQNAVEKRDPNRLAYVLKLEEKTIQPYHGGALSIAILALLIPVVALAFRWIAEWVKHHRHLGVAEIVSTSPELGSVWQHLFGPSIAIILGSLLLSSGLKYFLRRRLSSTLKMLKDAGGSHDVE